MQDLADRVAVITGAASGIGQGLARRLAREGMKLVLADIEEAALLEVEKELRLGGTPVLAVKTDVSRKESVFALADRAFDAFGRVHIVCNNAGVSGGLGHIWEIPDQDWEWIMAVNLYGVLHGIQAFVPRMIEHGEEGLILNTSSVVGLTTGTSSVYGVTKHAVSRMTEGLHYDLRAAGSKLRAALLVPGATATNILYADRNRPQAPAGAAQRGGPGSPDPAASDPPPAFAGNRHDARTAGRHHGRGHPSGSVVYHRRS